MFERGTERETVKLYKKVIRGPSVGIEGVLESEIKMHWGADKGIETRRDLKARSDKQ